MQRILVLLVVLWMPNNDNNNNNGNRHRPPGPSRDNNSPYGPPPSKRGRRGIHNRGTSGRFFHDSREANLKRAVANIPPCHAKRSPGKNPNKIPHVALLFITINDLPYEHIWKEWASAENQEMADLHVSVVCHAKFPRKVQSSWLKQRLLVDPPIVGRGNEYESPKYHTRMPDWGSIEITRAMMDLVQEGLDIGYSREKDERFSTNRYSLSQNTKDSNVTSVDKFIFVSETCLPILSLSEVRKALFGGKQTTTTKATSSTDAAAATPPQLAQIPQRKPLWDVSWVNARNTPNNGYSRQLQFDKIHGAIPVTLRWKADQWMVLSRFHAAAIMDIDRHLPRDMPLWRCFITTKASDELYFPTGLAMLNVLKENNNKDNEGDTATNSNSAKAGTPKESGQSHSTCATDQIALRRVTYADWSLSAKNPASFCDGVKDLKKVATLARSEGCLFARKFCPDISESERAISMDGAQKQYVEGAGCISVEEWKKTIHELEGTSFSQ
mmetsp:Transcript_13982/g.21820  ORF Transcript_13982/g.21820 Transcript_13982/m.21820 type:complete len:498 (+) Transcript_13982:1284-2777(+)